MRYFLVVKTFPGQRLNETELNSILDVARIRISSAVIYRLHKPEDADIAVWSLEDEIENGDTSLADFERFCLSLGCSVNDETGSFTPIAAQEFLENKWGQEVFTAELPVVESAACEVYSAIANFALEMRLRLYSPMPGVGDINPETPGRLPPDWHHFALIGQKSNPADRY